MCCRAWSVKWLQLGVLRNAQRGASLSTSSPCASGPASSCLTSSRPATKPAIGRITLLCPTGFWATIPEIIDALTAAACEGASPADLGRSLAYAAALRVARFGTANEHSDWETAHHVLTYTNALHQALKRSSVRVHPSRCLALSLRPRRLRSW